MKTQAIRLIDVFVLGPFLLIAARQASSDAMRLGLVAAGIATIAFNGVNYLRLRRGEPGITEGV